jgi:hypothetical protein
MITDERLLIEVSLLLYKNKKAKVTKNPAQTKGLNELLYPAVKVKRVLEIVEYIVERDDLPYPDFYGDPHDFDLILFPLRSFPNCEKILNFIKEKTTFNFMMINPNVEMEAYVIIKGEKHYFMVNDEMLKHAIENHYCTGENNATGHLIFTQCPPGIYF